MSAAAWWNGRPVAAEAVALAPDDAGFRGDGLFETLRVDGGRVRDLDAHLDRLLAGLLRIDLPIPEGRRELAAAVRAVAKAAPRPCARLRIAVTRGAGGVPTRLVTATAYEPPSRSAYRQGVAAVVLHDLRLEKRGTLTGLKSLSYGAHALAQRRAEAAGAWEALLLDDDGLFVEGSRSNLVLVLEGGRAYTPRAADGCVPGTVRRRLLEAGLIDEGEVFDEDLETASEVLLTNSLVGVLPVGRIGERQWVPGPVGRRLRKAVRR
ncbi:MAG TPA: aminotransferase class IV [Thermoanaerobaculia bacterium]|nr:aminotransferase class IV [Thermoanaerobaculia bacterium]